MTDPHELDLQQLDDVGRDAARGLRLHVDQHVDVERHLATLPTGAPTPKPRSRILAVAAAVVVLGGMILAIGNTGGDDGRSRLDVDADGNPLPDPEPGTLTPLGPQDGKDSMRLPVTIEPLEGLTDGGTVTVSGSGFAPGEEVGIVQCASEAGGGDAPETAAGIDGCSINIVEYAYADEAGDATGTFDVRRVVTTPLTGTVDCAAEPDRCIVAMGAITDYDRSGGVAFIIAGGDPVDIPTLAVNPADGLGDGDVVRITGKGYQPGEQLSVEVCSTDPSSCWATGADLARVEPAPNEDCFTECSGFGLQVEVDDRGTIDAELPVYRFLPSEEPGRYVDCAISDCRLRVTGSTAPPPAPLVFFDDGTTPEPPAVDVDRTTGLRPGETVVVRGGGFEPGTSIYLSVCGALPGSADPRGLCSSADDSSVRADDDGSFAVEIEVPEMQGVLDSSPTTTCVGACDGSEGQTEAAPANIGCDGESSRCFLVADTYYEEPGDRAGYRARFSPAPVPVTYYR